MAKPWAASGVALEIEGGLYGVGRKCPTCGRRRVAGHSSIERLKSDREKYREAAILGWRVLTFLPDEMTSLAFVEPLRRALGGNAATEHGGWPTR